MLLTILAICTGASAGALMRWFLGVQLNSLFPSLPPGTLTANLLGGYGIGIAIAYFASHPTLAPEWRLLVITGFLGGFTTFSTFSAETVALLQEGRWLWSLGIIASHVCGSILMTLAGFATMQALRGS